MSLPEGAIVLPRDGGRRYEMGALWAVFKADEAETGARYSVSEWWLHPHTDGPGAHSHEANDEIFFVIAGNPEIRIGDEWVALAPGSFVRIPARVVHDFRNTTDADAGLLNVFIPGGFERKMPAIVDWFAKSR